MSNMYSRESIAAAARQRGHSEEEITRILANIDRLKQRGLVKTSARGSAVGLTRAGARKVAELKAAGVIVPR
jgi:molybdenum-dependent DNA-binding transcriptional regulator ModE